MTGPDDLSIETDFGRWREGGDVDSLGRVFDATAACLLLTALRLGFDDATARDLVQRTFLVAIEEPERWDAERPVLPWLAGVLALEGRRARRDLQREPDPASLPRERLAADPSDRASQRELGARAEQVIAELPQEQRTVLVLHLLHGLEPVEIARALEVPAPTVRTRLHRGLKALRARLGVEASGAFGLAWTGEFLADDRAVLAVIREQVLRAAVARGTPVAAGAVAGAVAVSGWSVLALRAATVAVVLMAGWGVVHLVWPASGQSAPRAVDAAGRSAGDTASESQASRAVGSSKAAPELPRRAVAADPEADAPGFVRVRVVDAAGAPAVGVVVARILSDGGELPSSTNYRMLTDARGEANVPLHEEGKPGRDGQVCYVTVVEPGIELDRHVVDLRDPPARLPDFQLPATGAIEVLLVDPEGRPIEDLASMVSLRVEGERRRDRGFGNHARPLEVPVAGDEELPVHRHGSVRIPGGRLLWPHCALGLRVRFEVGHVRWSIEPPSEQWMDGPIRPGEVTQFTLRLREAVRLHGQFDWRGEFPLPDSHQLMGRIRTGGEWQHVGCLPRGERGFTFLLPNEVRPESVEAIRLQVVSAEGLRGLQTEKIVRLGAGGGPHDIGTLVIAPMPRIASGRFVDQDGESIEVRDVEALVIRDALTDSEWRGYVRCLGGDRFEVRGPEPCPERLRIDGEHVGLGGRATARLDGGIEFGRGDHGLLLRLHGFAQLEVGCVDAEGAPSKPVLRLVDGHGKVCHPNFWGHLRDGVAVHSFPEVPLGTWRLEIALPGDDRVLRTIDGLVLDEARIHWPAALQRLVLADSRSFTVRAVEADGVPVDVSEGRYYVADSRDPDLWHGQLFLGATARIPLRLGSPSDCVIQFAGYEPVLLRDLHADQDIRLVALDPEREPPPQSGPPQRYRIDQPQIDFAEELSGAPFPAAWWTAR